MAAQNKILFGDFHMHTNFSKDCRTPPDKLLESAIRVGLTCIAVTDHNTAKGGLEVQRLARERGAPIKVVVAEEVMTTDGEVTALFIKEDIPKLMSPMDTIRAIKSQGGLVSLPHPYDRIRHSPMKSELIPGLLPHLDIIEVFNARTTFMGDIRKAKELAEKNNMAAGAGSDAHTAWELGHVYVEFPDFNTPYEFKESLMHWKGIRARRSTPLVHLFSRYAKWSKTLGCILQGSKN